MSEVSEVESGKALEEDDEEEEEEEEEEVVVCPRVERCWIAWAVTSLDDDSAMHDDSTI